MIQAAPIREYKRRPLKPEMRDKLDRCYRESLDLTERELRCPHCSRYIASLFSDASGHFKMHCKNCKTVTIFDLGCFRRLRRRKRNARK